MMTATGRYIDTANLTMEDKTRLEVYVGYLNSAERTSGSRTKGDAS